MEVFTTEYFGLFVIICLGFILGSIKIKGISLDISAIIFVALIFGHYGMTMPPIIGKLGLVLFIYTIGMQAGPGFFESFRKQGRNLAILATIIVGSAAIITLIAFKWTGIETPVAIGLLSGALTSTPGLAAAIDATGSSLVSIGYGIAYPFGVIGVILFVRLYPKLIKADLKKAEKEFEKLNESGYPEIKSKTFRVENENVIGKSISELKIRSMTKAVISRIMHEGDAVVPSPETVLLKGDLVKAVGTDEALSKFRLLIGNETDAEIPLHKSYEVQSILVTNKEAVNQPLGTFNLWSNYQATVTRLRRSGIDITPSPSMRLHMGDKLTVACSRENMKQVVRIFGNDDKKLSDTDFFPVAAGIVLGILLGELSLSFGGGMSFNLGLTGGILVVAMILSRIGRTGPVIWSMSGAATQLLRQIGLMFFLVEVGTKAGAQLVDTYAEYGSQLFVIGGVITLVPMILAVVASHFMKNMNILTLLGGLTGSMTSTPGLAAVDSMTDTNAPAIAYATVYPVAMVLLIIFIQLLALF
ncbi:MAG: putative transport protein [Anaerophaga sp.]|uniref:aspartate:alanine exchanger family transporter n=1 Tax=Anaerophaga thermohalophila TaxID=177400 RepID=UPI000237CA60|nr:TrkA C-terminal domain-containing protein [Anaerophaga thermohalophila]MDI3520125.1 putative transport protein [Anaerophaga sp.]MDN5291881.1 putative transport protein [Anaerophaga sp.]